MTKDFNILVNKINSYRNRFYLYKIAEGFFITISLLLILFTLFSILEFFIYLNSYLRKIIFYGFILFGSLLIIQFIAFPFLKLLHILKPVDIKRSAKFIQNYFPEIKDKLLNVIELSGISESNYSIDILKASIDQKIEELKVFNFKKAVQFKNLKMVIIHFILSIIISFSIYLVNSSIYVEPVKRIVNYNTAFTKPAPFLFHLINKKLVVKKGESYNIILKCTGDQLPQNVYINIEGNNFLMKSRSDENFEYEVASVINNIEFYFTDMIYKSQKYLLNVLPAPGINTFNIKVEPPAYTRLEDKNFNNIGDIQVPSGSLIKWKFSGVDIDTLYLSFMDSIKSGALKDEQNDFNYIKNFYKTTDYNVIIENFKTDPKLALSSTIDVIQDLYPEIKIISVQDSVRLSRFYFKGKIGDDYGFTALNFHFNIENSDSTIVIPIINNLTDQDFYFSFDFSELDFAPGTIYYYFKVIDNDILNGYKSTTSDNFTYIKPNKTEIALSEDEQFKHIEELLKQSNELTNEIQNDLNIIQFKNMDPNISDWEKSQMVNEIINKQDRLEQLYEEIKKSNENLNNYINSYNPQNEIIKEKQKEIEELFDEVFTDELKELLKEFNKLAREFDDKKFNQLSNKMQISYEDLQNQMDRNLEMLKKMKVEKEIQDVIDELSVIGSEEDNLQKEISEKRNFEEILSEILKHDKQIRFLQDRLNDALKLNSGLSRPVNFDNFEDEFTDIKESIKNSIEHLQKKMRRKSENSLHQTSDFIKNTVFAMQQMLNSNNIEQQTENIQNLKQILSNLIYLSFSQEEIIKDLKGISINDPFLKSINIQQKRISDQNNIVKDSLYALAKRTPQINSTINNELLNIEFNLEKTSDQLSEGLFADATVSQRYVMTSLNNLALLLNEALENIEKQLANAMPGDCQCENPNAAGQEGMNLLKETSENIKKQLQKMIEQFKNGGSENMNEQFGQMLIEHEMMQQMLREILNSGNVGSGAKSTLQQIDNMLEQNRKQLLDKKVNAEMITRQNLITTRLLDAEKANLEREFEEKRERKLAEDFYSNPVEFFEFIKEENIVIEMLNKDSHKLTNFYNQKFKEYINKVED